MSNYEWMADALCAQTDPEIFFPENGRYDEARKICAACPVRRECAEQATAIERGLCHTYRHGAWGGTSPRQRARTNDVTFYKARANDIVRMAEAGWNVERISIELNCTKRTVWRTLADHQRSLGEAA